MSFAVAVLAEEAATKLPMEPWVFGVVALCVFTALALVLFTYRDVANRHTHHAAPDAAAHAGAPGATHHGAGHPGTEHAS
jgi:hypothetical protein